MKTIYVIGSTFGGLMVPYVMGVVAMYDCTLDGAMGVMLMAAIVGLVTSRVGLSIRHQMKLYVIGSTVTGSLLPYAVALLTNYGCTLDGVFAAMAMCGFVGLATSLIGLRLAS